MVKRIRNEKQKEVWITHKKAWKKSGVSKEEYAKKNGISKHAFYKWCQKLDEKKSASDRNLDPGMFHKVRTEIRPQSEIRVLFPNGLILEMPEDIPSLRLSEIIKLWM